jgi:hypothetical protein
MSHISDYQVDHLLLLVGSNPLPNAVAGKLLTAPGGKITLISSRDGFPLAERLGKWFQNVDISLKEVRESEAASVEEKVSEAIEQYERDHARTNAASPARVGLNYTGGTKVMSVHAYRALEQWASKHKRKAVFSYLDARTLQMRFEQVDGWPALPVSLAAEISIRDLLTLHGWELRKDPLESPVLPKSAAALLAIHSRENDAAIWADWLHESLFRSARKPDPIAPPFWVFQAGNELEGQLKVTQAKFDSNWKNNTDLRKLALPWPPDLPALREAMSNELGQHDGYLNLAAVRGKGCKDEQDFCKWLSGTWLESAVLAALQNCPEELHLKACAMDLKVKVPDKKAEGTETPVAGKKVGGTEFQFDVVAMRGYQLFAFSCTTESARKRGGRELVKQKLFEAYVRARQMGGDEACVAMVCCMDQEEADKLQEEMRRDISPEERIQVFGRECLANLTDYIADWVRQQSKEG